MSPTVFGIVFLCALALASATRLWLAWRQVRHVRAHRGQVPPAFAQAISLAAHQKAADYTIAKNRLGAVELAVGALVLVALTLGGGLQLLLDQWSRVFAAASCCCFPSSSCRPPSTGPSWSRPASASIA